MSRLFRKFGVLGLCGFLGFAALPLPATDASKSEHKTQPVTEKAGRFPVGKAMVWEDRGELNPRKVYWGAASVLSDPLSRLPAPPFGKFQPDTTLNATSPKAKLTDSNKVKWTVKFGAENHADTIAPRLAWALGFGTVEGYYVESGKINGITPTTDLGEAKGWIQPDGTFTGGARFKRHDEENAPVKDAKGDDMNWDEANNPGVPPEQLSGLLIFEVMVNNWDAQPKNCKIYHTTGPNGPENWYIDSDMGASFADVPRHKFVLSDYQKEPSFIKQVNGNTVEFNFVGIVRAQGKLRQQIPLAHARWFRKQLAKLTDDEIQAAFDAGFATDGLNRAYASGDPAQIKAAREKELSSETRTEIAGFVAKFRSKIDEYMQKIPAG